MGEPLRVRFVPGVAPDKWLRTWAARMPGSPLDAGPVEPAEQTAVLRSGAADMCFVRLPVDRAGLHVVPLYEEVPVVVVPRDHPVAAFDEVDVRDLAGEHLLQDPAEVPEWRAVAEEVRSGTRRPVPAMSVAEAIEVVAAGAGVVVVPMSLARLHHRKDVVHRPVTGVAGSGVALAWRAADDDPRVETFLGIVRGRTERSSRGPAEPSTAGRGGPPGEKGAGRGGGGSAARRRPGGRPRRGPRRRPR